MRAIKTTVAIIGATPIGRVVALRALQRGCRVVLEDVSEARLEAAVQWIGVSLADRPGRGSAAAGSSGSFSSVYIANFTIAREVEAAIRGAGFIVEALADDVEMKIELFTIFDKFAKPGAVFATTGGIAVEELAEVTFCAERCVGIRVELGGGEARFEVMAGRETSAETVGQCFELFGAE
ncbi:MAG TPA: 3-hydroxyacyl-CoA dehydrogenase NAD-binding domain-containing protein [Candidatus Acidoferrum sp.]